MANELATDYLSGKNVYFLLRNTTSQIWNGASFENYSTANYANYFITATEQGTASGFYVANIPAVAAGLYVSVAKERIGGSPAETDITIGTGGIQWGGSSADLNTYQAKAWFDVDGSSTDRYTVAWFVNSQPVTSGITLPTIQVWKTSDGTDLIASTAMTQIGTTGTYKYSATGSQRQTAGASYVIKVTATINGAVRTWLQPMSRDA